MKKIILFITIMCPLITNATPVKQHVVSPYSYITELRYDISHIYMGQALYNKNILYYLNEYQKNNPNRLKQVYSFNNGLLQSPFDNNFISIKNIKKGTDIQITIPMNKKYCEQSEREFARKDIDVFSGRISIKTGKCQNHNILYNQL